MNAQNNKCETVKYSSQFSDWEMIHSDFIINGKAFPTSFYLTSKVQAPSKKIIPSGFPFDLSPNAVTFHATAA